MLAGPSRPCKLKAWNNSTTQPPPITKPATRSRLWRWAGPCSASASWPIGNVSAIAQFGKGVFRPSEDWLEREILIALGGIAAEARYTGAYAWSGAARDRQYVRRAGRAARRRTSGRTARTPPARQGRTSSFARMPLAGRRTHRRGVAAAGRPQRPGRPHLFDRGNEAC